MILFYQDFGIYQGLNRVVPSNEDKIMKYKTALYINRPILKALRNLHPFKNVGRKNIDGLGSFYIYEYTGPSFDTEEIVDLMTIVNDCQYYCPFISINRPVR